MPLGYTITEYELPTPSGVEDYSCGNFKSGFFGGVECSGPLSMGSPLKMAQIRPRFPDFARFSTSNLGSYNLRPQRELEAHIRWLCSPGAVFEMIRSDFHFFDFFAKIFSIFENLKSWKTRNFVTIGFPIVILGENHPKSVTSDFSESRTTLGTAVYDGSIIMKPSAKKPS